MIYVHISIKIGFHQWLYLYSPAVGKPVFKRLGKYRMGCAALAGQRLP